MRTTFFLTVLCMLMLTASCSSSTSESTESAEPTESTASAKSTVPFTEANHYFFRNDAQMPSSPKITTQQEFESYFGMAAVMGDGGQPTAIDFDQQFVIAVVMPVTDIETEIDPEKVELEDNTLTYTYEVEMGEKQTYTSQPISIIILNKKYQDAQVKLAPRTVKD